MINRNRYSLEFKQKIARELALGTSITEICKREGISVQTLTKWKNRFGFNGQSEVLGDQKELMELRKKVALYEAALGEMAMELHLLKKVQQFSLQQQRKKNLSGVISPSTWESRKVAG